MIGPATPWQPPRPRLHLVPSPADTVTAEQLPLEFLLPTGLPAVPEIPGGAVAPRPGTPGGSPVAPWAARLAQAVLEVVAAERPVTQLTSWVRPEIYQRLHRRQLLTARQLNPSRPRGRCPEQVRSVHICHPSPEVAEVSVVTSGTGRCRAMALRLEQRKGRWLCTELDWV